MKRQPILGPNAKPFFIQLAIGVAVAFTAYFATRGWLPDLIHQGVCTYVIGPC